MTSCSRLPAPIHKFGNAFFPDKITGWTRFLESCSSFRYVLDLSLYLGFAFSRIEEESYPAEARLLKLKPNQAKLLYRGGKR